MPTAHPDHHKTIKGVPATIQKHKEAVVFRLSAMGDVALLTGVLRYWHEEFGMRFIIITRSAFIDLFKNHPAVIDVYPLKKEDLQGKAYRKKCEELSQKYANYPLFDMHASTRSRLLASFWKNTVLRYNKLPIYRRVFLWTKGFFGSEKLLEKNVCQRYASLLSKSPHDHICREALVPQIYLSNQEIENAKLKLDDLFNGYLQARLPAKKSAGIPAKKTDELPAKKIDELPAKKIIALHPFATHSSKTLPMQSWDDLAKNITQKFGESHDILWLGIGELAPTFQGKSLVNKTSLRELCAILHHCDVLITGDSGPMHLANAVQCKLLVLFGPTCEEWGFYPVGKNIEIMQKTFSCRPCSLHGAKSCPKNGECLVAITHEEIIENLNKLLMNA